MRLTKLKLAGFKSFVDPTTVLLPGQLVGVVGPNGCGKSNIMDAVRWVLGETRASELRGESMQDVIFNGSGGRKPVGRASVELIFDNSLGRASGQWSGYAEIAVKRVLDRTGTSSYHINNVHVRRRDVVDLFLGTGLGPRAYAIIGQGMISRIIEARPEDLRLFLEEAAGVTKYRERRKETEGRLADARENLERLEDIRNELATQIEHLAEQAEVAQRYQSFSAELTRQQALLWYVRRRAARAEVAQVTVEIQQSVLRLDQETARLRSLEATLEEVRNSHFAATDALQSAQSAFYGANAEVARLEGELGHRRDTRRRLEARLTQLAEETVLWQERAEVAEEDFCAWQDKEEAARLRLEMVQERHGVLAEALPDAEEALARVEQRRQTVRRELSGLEQQLRVEETHGANARRALDTLAQRRARLLREQGELSEPDSLELEERRETQAQLQWEIEEQQQNQLEAQTALPEIQAQVKTALEQEKGVLRRMTEARARRDALAQLQAKVGRDPGLDAWKTRLGLTDLVPLWQHLHIEAGWQDALEAVLRERLSSLAVTPEQLAAACRQPPSARLVLVCPQTEAGQIPAADPVPGQVSLLSLVRCQQAAWQPLLSAWLAGVGCCDDLTPHLADRHQLAPGELRVDRAGRCLSRHGLTFHAPEAGTHGALERQEEMAALDVELDKLEAQSRALKAQVQESEQALAGCQERLNQARRRSQEYQQKWHQLELELVRLSQARQRFEEHRARFEQDRAELVEVEEQERERLEQASFAMEALSERLEALTEQAELAEADWQRAESAVRSARSAEQVAARECQAAEFACREAAGRLRELERGRELARGQLARIAQEQAQKREEEAHLESGVLESELGQALALRVERERELAQRRDVLESAGQQLRRQEEERLRTEQSLAPLRDGLAEWRLKEQAARLQEVQCGERLLECGIEEEKLLLLMPEDARALKESVLSAAITRLNREMTALGPVNLAALEEVVTARKRKGFLDEQSGDLNQAISTLEDAIRRIDRETREQLKDTYEKVNAHFGKLFPELFGGGEARLILTGEEILDAGIQVMARPPGKKNSTIHLLSGGEKALTAIALVFSLFQLNPAPFCVLDEVDAPLDDSNTERFCAMVRRMSCHTQFLFISHSRITMEMAEQLVGVTMQESGVSRVVEVDMEEALKMREVA